MEETLLCVAALLLLSPVPAPKPGLQPWHVCTVPSLGGITVLSLSCSSHPTRESGPEDHETVGHAPSEAVVQDNLVLFRKPRRSLMKFLVQKLQYCNEEKEKGYFKS